MVKLTRLIKRISGTVVLSPIRNRTTSTTLNGSRCLGCVALGLWIQLFLGLTATLFSARTEEMGLDLEVVLTIV